MFNGKIHYFYGHFKVLLLVHQRVSHDSCNYPLAIEHSELEAMAIMALFEDDFPSELKLHLFHHFVSHNQMVFSHSLLVNP